MTFQTSNITADTGKECFTHSARRAALVNPTQTRYPALRLIATEGEEYMLALVTQCLVLHGFKEQLNEFGNHKYNSIKRKFSIKGIQVEVRAPSHENLEDIANHYRRDRVHAQQALENVLLYADQLEEILKNAKKRFKEYGAADAYNAIQELCLRGTSLLEKEENMYRKKIEKPKKPEMSFEEKAEWAEFHQREREAYEKHLLKRVRERDLEKQNSHELSRFYEEYGDNEEGALRFLRNNLHLRKLYNVSIEYIDSKLRLFDAVRKKNKDASERAALISREKNQIRYCKSFYKLENDAELRDYINTHPEILDDWEINLERLQV